MMLTSKKVVALAAAGIVAGTLLQGLVLTANPNSVYSSKADELRQQVNLTHESRESLEQFLAEDKRFSKIEDKATKTEFGNGTAAKIPALHTQLQAHKDNIKSQPLRFMFPLSSGYREYVDVLQELDSEEHKLREANNDVSHALEFQQTCDFVEDLEEGMDMDPEDKDAEVGPYVGYTPDNFEIYLQACGDKDLDYLEDLSDWRTERNIDLSQQKPGQSMSNCDAETKKEREGLPDFCKQ